MATSDECSPRNMSVRLPLDYSDNQIAYYPECTMVQRCGGCCPTQFLSCEPRYKEKIVLKVRKTGQSWERRLVAYTEARRQLVGLERRLVAYTEAQRQLVADWLARWTVNPVAMAQLWHTTRRRTVLSFFRVRTCRILSRHVSACLPFVCTARMKFFALVKDPMSVISTSEGQWHGNTPILA